MVKSVAYPSREHEFGSQHDEPMSDSLQPPVTLAAEDQTVSSGPCGYYTHVAYIHTNTYK